MLAGGAVESGSDDFAGGAAQPAAHVGDFFGPLVYQQHQQHHFGVVDLYGAGDLFHDRGLAGLGRRDDETALALADRRQEIHDAGGHVEGVAFSLQAETLVGEERGELTELGAVFGEFRLLVVD